jgi:uncharacterized alkaline shock family protein YloU
MTTIDPEVLLTIARLTTLGVAGVSRMGEVPASVRGFLRRKQEQGVSIRIEGMRVDVDVYAILQAGIPVRETSRLIQQDIARAISEMVGMEAGEINVHIDDIDYPA